MTSKFMTLAKKGARLIIDLIKRYPSTIALFGFVSGVASFFLVEREQEKFAQMLSLLMLASWIWLTLENLLHKGVSHWFGIKLPEPILKFATQLVHQESLFFVIPFFFITTTWNSGQLIFTSLLIIAACISIVDPLYYGWLATKRWLYFIFHGITLFAVLLTALPIIFYIPTPQSYLWSLGIAVLLSFLNVVRELPFNWWRRIIAALLLIAVAGGVGVMARPWVPPATLWLTKVAVTDEIDNKNRAPQNQLKRISVDQLRNGLYAYTAIHAPRGLNERIYHEWRLNGNLIDRIALNINGGREAGYRAWSHKLNFPPYPAGRWQIRVMTEAHQVIGVLRFQVVKSSVAVTEEIAPQQQNNKVEDADEVTPEKSIRTPITEFIKEEAKALLIEEEQSSSAQSETEQEPATEQQETIKTDTPKEEPPEEELIDNKVPEPESSGAESTDVETKEIESTEVESTEVESTDIEGTESNSIEPDDPEPDSTAPETAEPESTKLESTELESTKEKTPVIQ